MYRGEMFQTGFKESSQKYCHHKSKEIIGVNHIEIMPGNQLAPVVDKGQYRYSQPSSDVQDPE